MTPSLGIIHKIAAVFTFTCMYVCIKATAPDIPAGQVAFFRSLFALVPIGLYLFWRGEFPAALYTKRPLGHFWRGLFGSTAMILNFAALGLLPLPDAIAIGYGVPMFTAIFGALLLGEVIRRHRWAAIVVGLIGVLIIMWPRLEFVKGNVQSSGETIGALCAIAATACVGLAFAQIRILVRTETTSSIVVYFSLSASVFALLTLPFGWAVPSPMATVLLITTGLIGGVGQIFLTECYRHAEISTVAPFEYTSLLFGIAFGYLLFSEIPTVWMLVGAAIVIGAGCYLIWKEHQRAPARRARG